MKDEEIEVYINGEKVDITDIYEPLKQGEYFYKENGKWYVHRLENISFVMEKDKKIEKLKIVENGSINSYALLDKNGIKCALTKHSKIIADKINEIIEVLNERDI